MTKKHFIAIATAFSQIEDMYARKHVVLEFIEVAMKLNKNFNPIRFKQACGM